MRPQPAVNNTDAYLAEISGKLDQLLDVLRQDRPDDEPEPEAGRQRRVVTGEARVAAKAAPAKAKKTSRSRRK